MRSAALFLACALACPSVACSEPEVLTPQGSWTAPVAGGRLFFNLVITGTTVTGTGSYAVLTNPQPVAITITGQWIDPQVSLMLAGFPGGTATFAGARTSQGTLSGTLDGGGFTNQAVTFTRGS